MALGNIRLSCAEQSQWRTRTQLCRNADTKPKLVAKGDANFFAPEWSWERSVSPARTY